MHILTQPPAHLWAQHLFGRTDKDFASCKTGYRSGSCKEAGFVKYQQACLACTRSSCPGFSACTPD